MSNYNESNISGIKWTRAKRVTVYNEYKQIPNILFTEEELVSLGGDDFIAKPAGSVSSPLMPENMLTEFNLLNPETGEVVGTATYQQVYVLLHSLYLHLAAERDAAPVTP